MKIFVSYSTKDRQLVENLVDDLASLGHDAWFDNLLIGGNLWWDMVLKAIRDCDVCIVALTPNAVASNAVRLEYGYAEALNKIILPVLLSDDVDLGSLPATLAHLQFVDFRKQDKQSALDLSRALESLGQPKPLPDPLPAPPPVPTLPLANISSKVQTSEMLSLGEQAELIERLKPLVDEPEMREDARILLTRFSNRADLGARSYDDIQNILASTETKKLSKAEPQPDSEGSSIVKSFRELFAPKDAPQSEQLSLDALSSDLRHLVIQLQQRPDLVPEMLRTLHNLLNGTAEQAGYVFISYSSKNRDFVLKLANDLTSNGLDVWLDVWRITGRQPYWNEIQTGVEQCSHFLFVISPEALIEESGALTELYHVVGLKPKRIIVPIVAEAYPFERLPMVISPGRYQIHDFTKSAYNDMFARVLNALS